MVSKTRREIFAIEKQLLSRASQFSFVQAIRLLHLLGTTTKGADPFDSIRVRPNLAWSSPSQEIIGVEKSDEPPVQYRLTVTFLELYGVGSPLPSFYTQELYSELNSGGTVSREFVDIFNGALYEIYFNIWKKYNLSYRLFEAPDSSLWEQLFCVAGLGNSSLRNKISSPQSQITFSGLVSRPIRTAEGLRTILFDLIGEVPVQIEQCVLRMAPIPKSQHVRVGQTATSLGIDTIIGKQIRDRMGAFRVHIGPVQAKQLEQFVPDSVMMSTIKEQICLYIDQPLEWDIEVSCGTRGMNTVKLGGANAHIGYNTWVFSGTLPQETVSARFKPSL